MGTVTTSGLTWHSGGDEFLSRGKMIFSTSYTSSGETFSARLLGLGIVNSLAVSDAEGYSFRPDVANLRVQVWGNRPAAGSIGNNFVVAASAPATAAPLSVAFGGAYPTTASAAMATGGLLADIVSVVSSTVSFNAAISTSLTTVTVRINNTTGGTLTGSFPLYVGTSNLNAVHTTATTQTDFWYIGLSDGGAIPVSSDTTGGWAVRATNSAAAGLMIATTATVSVNVAISTSRALSLGANYNRLAEVSAAADLSTVSAQFQALGSG